LKLINNKYRFKIGLLRRFFRRERLLPTYDCCGNNCFDIDTC